MIVVKKWCCLYNFVYELVIKSSYAWHRKLFQIILFQRKFSFPLNWIMQELNLIINKIQALCLHMTEFLMPFVLIRTFIYIYIFLSKNARPSLGHCDHSQLMPNCYSIFSRILFSHPWRDWIPLCQLDGFPSHLPKKKKIDSAKSGAFIIICLKVFPGMPCSCCVAPTCYFTSIRSQIFNKFSLLLPAFKMERFFANWSSAESMIAVADYIR